LLVTATFAIIMTPGLAAGPAAMKRVWSGQGHEFFAPLAVLVTVGFFVAHILSTIARSRSPWATLDLIAVALLATAGWLIVRPLVDAAAFEMLQLILKTGGWLLLVVAILAGAWQLSVGRTDRQRSHFAMSRFLWSAIAVALAICGVMVWWVVSPRPTDLRGPIEIQSAPRGDWAFVGGGANHRRDYHPIFLINAVSGAYRRIGAGPVDAHFVGDGNRILVGRPIDRLRNGNLELFIGHAAGNREESTGLIVPRWTSPLIVSDDANRIAYMTGEVLSVYDIPQQRSLGSVRLPAGSRRVGMMRFTTPTVLRIWTFTGERMTPTPVPRAIQVFEYDTSMRSLRMTGQFSDTARYLFFSADATGSHLIVRNPQGGNTLIDGRTAAPLATLPPLTRTSILSDGRIAGVEAPQGADTSNVLAVFNNNGVLERKISFDRPAIFMAREIAPGKMLVGARNGLGESARGWVVMLVDINSGTILRREDDLLPVWVNNYADVRREPFNANQLFIDVHGAVLRWNLLTNEKSVLVPGRS
jgi:hypothetical protein